MVTGPQLKHFTPNEIIITPDEARDIYRFMFKEHAEIMATLEKKKELQHFHMEFAQALLVEALDRTYDAGFLEALFKSMTDKKRTINSAKKLLQKFGKKAFKHWFKHATEDDLWDDPEIYETVRVFIRRNWHQVAFFVIVNDDSAGY